MIPLISPIPSFSFINFISLIEPITVIILFYSINSQSKLKFTLFLMKEKRKLICLLKGIGWLPAPPGSASSIKENFHFSFNCGMIDYGPEQPSQQTIPFFFHLTHFRS